MHLRTVVIISTLLLMTNGYNQTTEYAVTSIPLTNSSGMTVITSNPSSSTQSLKTNPPTKCKDNKVEQLIAYKVVTALLCCILLILFLIRFTRPTVKALQKRLSDRRQNRWIGPTQSHSVSYHRGKTAVKNNDGDKRLSYPALDRLVITDSREPSSNRNSDYNL